MSAVLDAYREAKAAEEKAALAQDRFRFELSKAIKAGGSASKLAAELGISRQRIWQLTKD